MTLNKESLQEIVEAVLTVTSPSAVILFGSHARGNPHETSDVDLLVLRDKDFGPGESRRKELGALYRAVTKACDSPKDIILFTKREFQNWRNTTNHMASVAWKEGRILYGKI